MALLTNWLNGDLFSSLRDKVNAIVAAVNAAGTGTAGQVLRRNSSTTFDFSFSDDSVAAQTSNSGKLLTTNGTVTSWLGNEAWTAVAAYTSADISSGTVYYRKGILNRISLKGTITLDSSVGSQTIVVFTLPSGYRPSATIQFASTVISVTGPPITIAKNLIEVTSAGVVTIYLDNAATAMNSHVLYLDIVSFYND